MMYETRELCCVGQDECVVVTIRLIAIHRSDREHLVIFHCYVFRSAAFYVVRMKTNKNISYIFQYEYLPFLAQVASLLCV
jgi:hypothetical protein